MSKQAFDAKIAALEALRQTPELASTALRRSLRDPSNYVISKAAYVSSDLFLAELVPDLLAAFDRALLNPKSDPQCWAKNATAKALKDLGHREPEPFLKGLRHIQMEP